MALGVRVAYRESGHRLVDLGEEIIVKEYRDKEADRRKTERGRAVEMVANKIHQSEAWRKTHP